MKIALQNQDNDTADFEISQNAPLDKGCISSGHSFMDGLALGVLGASITLFALTMILLWAKTHIMFIA